MSLVQVINSAKATAATTQTTPAISTTAGNVLVFFAAYNAVNAGAVTPSDSTGLTWVRVFGAPFAGSATGLTLDCWVAKNITGNAANTFTFATAGADTPTIFVAEFSGRNRLNPIDGSLTASDTVAAAGTHTTGIIALGANNDDIIAFNVSSTLSQTYAAGSNFTIPANGTNSAATGYDAFVQFRNNNQGLLKSNIYSVTLTDQLDAFIVALQIPTQPLSDEFLDFFIEEPEVNAVSTTYQQADIQPLIADVDDDWNNEFDDNDAWLLAEAGSAVVGASVAVNSAIQFYGDEMELLDEALDPILSIASYQQTDIFPLLCIEDPWDHFLTDEDYYYGMEDSNVVVPDSSPPALFVYGNDLDIWDDVSPDFFPDDFGNDDADLPPADGWWDWDAEEMDNWASVDDAFSNVNLAAPTPITIEDGWDHFAQDEDDYPVSDDWNTALNPLLSVEDPSWWDEEPDQYDGTTTDLGPAVPDNNPVIVLPDEWTEHFPTDDNDYVVIDDYAIVDVPPNPQLSIEDFWDHFPTEDDDYFIVDEYALVGVVPNNAVNVTDGWDFFPTDDDDYYMVVDEVLSANAPAPSMQYPVDDAWDWAVTDDDDYYVNDDFASLNNTPIVVEDAWDHFAQDDDEQFGFDHWIEANTGIELSFRESWDWTDDADDEEWTFRDSDPVSVPQPAAIEDAWDHFGTDDDHWAIPDDYAIINNITAPTQPVEDTWLFFEGDVEDNDIDWAVIDNQIGSNIYSTNPEYQVYLGFRAFTVIWLPEDEG